MLTSSLFLCVLGLLQWISASLGVILTEQDLALVQSTQYDFVIVGGGTAGNVVANRLTENPSFNVLVLEAGPSDVGVLELEIPFLCPHATPQTPWDWNYTTTPQEGLDGASIAYPRGRVLGGTSSVNCLVYTRGSKADFDRYANVTDDKSWSWDNMLPYFKKSEKFTPPSDRHNTSGQFDPAIHGFNGHISVSLPGAPTNIDGRIETAIDQLAGEFFDTLDPNDGTPLGFGWAQAVVDGPSGSRSSSSRGYLARKFLLRPNLHVLVNAQVSRVLQTGSQHGLPTFGKVEYRVHGNGSLVTVKATKEVIFSAGTINTPQVLLNSGIGDPSALHGLGINPRVNLPDVGMHLADHPILTLAWLVDSNKTFDDFNRNDTLQAEEIAIWQRTRQGVFTNGIAQHIGFVRIPDNSSIFDGLENPTAGPNSPHIEIFVSNFLLGNTPPEGNFMSISSVVLTPGSASRGSVTLTSPDPFATPVIDAGLFNSQIDVSIMRSAVKSVLRFVTSPVWEDYIIGPIDDAQPSLNSTDDEIDEFTKKNTRSAYHLVGTSRMSQKGTKQGVVDPDFKVKGVNGLRVVDASILPFVPAAHTQASTYALAEKAADVIKADHNY